MTKDTFYIWGEESYLLDREVARIIEEVGQGSPSEPEVLWLDADEMSPLELGQFLEFSPLFVLSRVVILKNPAWIGKSARKSRKVAESLQVLEDYWERDHPGQVLIITAPENNTSNPIVKLLHKKAQVINLKPLPPLELSAWCKEELERRQLKMAPAALQRMLNSGQDMYYLQNLMEKMSLLAGKNTVALQDLEEQLDLKQEVKVFKLTDALLDHNLKGTLTAFYQLQEQGEHHLLLLHMISRQYFTLGKIKSYQLAGISRSVIASETGQKDFVVKKMMEKTPQFSPAELRLGFEKLLAADMSFKSDSKDPQIIMETLLVELCSKK